MIDIKNNKLHFNNKEIIYIIDNENRPWFYANKIAEVLEYSRPRKAILTHVKDKYRKLFENFNSTKKGQLDYMHPNTVFINEPGLYQLIMKSKMDIAEKFQDWIYEEVLPSIRKYGECKTQIDMLKIYNAGIKHKDNIIKIKDNYIEKLTQTNEIAIQNYDDQIKIKDNYIEKLTHTNELAIKVLEKTNEEILNIKPKVVQDTIDINLRNIFCIIKISNNEFYVIRCQKRRFTSTLNKLKIRYPDLSIVYKLNYNPNSINLYNRIKESLNEELEFNGNIFKNEKYTNEELINKVKELIES